MTTNSNPNINQEYLIAQQDLFSKASNEFLENTEFDLTQAMLPEIEMAIFTSPKFIESNKHADYVYYLQCIKKLIATLEKARIVCGRMKDEDEFQLSI